MVTVRTILAYLGARTLPAFLCLLLGPTTMAEDTSRDLVQMTPVAEAASKKALAWLARTQREDGAWNGDFGGSTGVTGACALAFMSAGHVPGSGEYGLNTARAIHHLLNSADHTGLLYKPGTPGPPMYHHGLATLALAEAWGMSQDQRLGPAVKRAVDLIVTTQNKRGGWRYMPRIRDDDISVTVMMLMALRAARDAGAFVPKESIDQGVAYVKSCHQVVDGGFSYTPRKQTQSRSSSRFGCTAAGVLSLQVAGDYFADEVRSGVAYLLTRQPVGDLPVKEYYFYSHYYAAMGIYQAQSTGEWGRSAWSRWYPAITKELLSIQEADGSWSGAYEQYATAMAVLILDIPYRYLPIYQR